MCAQSFQENDLQQYIAQAVMVTNYTVSWLNTALGIEADRVVVQMLQDIPIANYAKGLLYTMLSMVRRARISHPLDAPTSRTP